MRVGWVGVHIRPVMIDNKWCSLRIIHSVQDGLVLEECHQLVHTPGIRKVGKGEAASKVEPKSRQAWAFCIEVSCRFSRQVAETASTIGFGFTETAVVS